MACQFVSGVTCLGVNGLLLAPSDSHSQSVPLLLSAKLVVPPAAIMRQSRSVPIILGTGGPFLFVEEPDVGCSAGSQVHIEPSVFNHRLCPFQSTQIWLQLVSVPMRVGLGPDCLKPHIHRLPSFFKATGPFWQQATCRQFESDPTRWGMGESESFTDKLAGTPRPSNPPQAQREQSGAKSMS
jgi:hypothetical protein